MRLLPWTLAALLTAAAATAPAPAGGQAAETPPERWGLDLAITLNGSGGNERLTLLTSEVGLRHLQTGTFEMGVGGRFRYGRSGGTVVARNVRGTANLDLYPRQPWSPFLFAAAESDPFRRLALRLNTGAGAKHTFWREGWDEVSLSGALLYFHERLEATDPALEAVDHTARWSGRARARRSFGERARLEQVAFYQPLWYRADDYLLELHTSARVLLVEGLALTLTGLYERDSTPAPGVRPDDWSIAFGLGLNTRW